VKVLLAWICCSAALSLGYLAGRAAQDLGAQAHAAAPSAAAVLAVASICLALIAAPAVRMRARCVLALLVLGAMALAGARGLMGSGAGEGPATWPSAARGQPRGLRELVVVGAATPGPQCELLVEDVGGERGILAAPADVCPLAEGQRIRVRAEALRPRTRPDLPGDFDPLSRARARGASSVLEIDHVFVVPAKVSPYWAFVAEKRHAAWLLTRGNDAMSFVAAATLGLRSALPATRRAELRAAGLGHLVAVSGVHVGVAAWMTYAALLRVGSAAGGSLTIGVLLSWLPLVGYVGLTGASPPAVRAAAMLALANVGVLVGRPVHGLTLLAVVTTAMLAFRPAWALDAGFQLSVCAMAAIVRAEPGSGLVRQSWRVSWAIAPIALLHFGDAPAYGVLGNVLAVPIFTLWVLPLGVAGWLLVPWIGPVALVPAAWGAQIVLDLSALLSRLPPVPDHVVATVAAALLLTGVVVGKRAVLRRLLPPTIACAAVVAVVLWKPSPPPPSPGTSYAFGSRRSHGSLFVGSSGACVHEPRISPARLARLLVALGVANVHAIDGKVDNAPHVVAARELLLHSGLYTPASERCPPAAETTLGPWLRACLRRTGARLAIVRSRPGKPPECHVGGRWQPLVL
jgi:competence protein ComEC